MKRSIFLLCMLLLTLCLYNEKAEAKVQGENRDEIVWELFSRWSLWSFGK